MLDIASIAGAANGRSRHMAKRKPSPGERKQAAREQREKEIAAAEARGMEDRPDNRRPTPERLAKGKIELLETPSAGIKRAFDRSNSPINSAFEQGNLTQRQVDAGDTFEKLCRAHMKSPGPRSCLDWSPRGGAGETISSVEFQVRIRARLYEATKAVGIETARILMSVCWQHDGTGPRRRDYRRWRLLSDGLSKLADLWGYPEDERNDR